MPHAISLAAYAVKVWDPEERESEPISAFDDEHDLLDFLHDCLNSLTQRSSRNEGQKQVLRVKSLKRDNRTLSGIIETGEYGIESTLLDVETGKEVHKRKTNEANMLPFYFLIDLPEGVDEGIILLQRTGMYGIRHILAGILDVMFDQRFPEYRLRFHSLVESKEIEKYQKGKVETIRFISFKIPSDITDAFDRGHKEALGHAELVVQAKRGSHLPINSTLSQFFSGKRELAKLVALKETNFRYDDIKIRSRVGRAARTMDLSDLKRLRGYHDISDEVDLDHSGHPKLSSIHRLAEALRDRLLAKLYPR